MTFVSLQISPKVPDNISNFTQTLKSLLELLDLEEEDEYGTLKPTDYAFKTTIDESKMLPNPLS
jgi:hypothetical protein